MERISESNSGTGDVVNLQVARTTLQPPLYFGNHDQILAVRYIEDCEKAVEALEKCSEEGHDHEGEHCDNCEGSGECECHCDDRHDCRECDGTGFEDGYAPPDGEPGDCTFLKGLHQDVVLEAFNTKGIG